MCVEWCGVVWCGRGMVQPRAAEVQMSVTVCKLALRYTFIVQDVAGCGDALERVRHGPGQDPRLVDLV